MFDQIEMMRDFFSKGGPVLVSIFLLSIVLWILILERYYFLYRICPEKVNQIVKTWQERQDHSSWYALKIKDGLVSEISTALKQNLIPIQTLTGILPLLGLLGTVTGMISIFEVLNAYNGFLLKDDQTRGWNESIIEARCVTEHKQEPERARRRRR